MNDKATPIEEIPELCHLAEIVRYRDGEWKLNEEAARDQTDNPLVASLRALVRELNYANIHTRISTAAAQAGQFESSMRNFRDRVNAIGEDIANRMNTMSRQANEMHERLSVIDRQIRRLDQAERILERARRLYATAMSKAKPKPKRKAKRGGR